ncbi:hypothetical protein BT96DRAFT_1008206 [Gymnopus androsaceus JB14]|uniref:Uncharacterized protein n=1 Tax=Gymnopus androsaceus JB14 TaxID=1447944 RepID=A0A6A4GFG0_9AGAR|nr:hypothetical protein BT96DRAFT_1008206 [Gymnopus androsaceus JB14]
MNICKYLLFVPISTREITNKLGQTGAGIENAVEIDMSKGNAFTNLWAKEREKCPWYFEMRNLIGDRPNAKPVGIGNSQSAIDLTVLDVSHEENGPAEGEELDEFDEDSGEPLEPVHKSAPTTDNEDPYNFNKYLQDSDHDENNDSEFHPKSLPDNISSDNSKFQKSLPSRNTPSIVSKQKTAPHAAASKATKLEDRKPMKKTKNDEFAEIAKEEEKTAQSELELAKMKTQLEVVQAEGLVDYRL